MSHRRNTLLFSVLCAILATIVVSNALNSLIGPRAKCAAQQRQSIRWIETLGGTINFRDDRRKRDEASYVDRVLRLLASIWA